MQFLNSDHNSSQFGESDGDFYTDDDDDYDDDDDDIELDTLNKVRYVN